MNDGKPTLDYEPPPRDRPSTQQMVMECISGCIMTMVFTAFGFSVALGIVADVRRNSRGMAPAVATACLLFGGIVGLVAWSADRNLKSPRHRPYGIGIWIGFGVFLLLAGFCFAAF